MLPTRHISLGQTHEAQASLDARKNVKRKFREAIDPPDTSQRRSRPARTERRPPSAEQVLKQETVERTQKHVTKIKKEDKDHPVSVIEVEVRKSAQPLMCTLYAEIETACQNKGKSQTHNADILDFIRAARFGAVFDDIKSAPTERSKTRIRDSLIEVEEQGYTHPAFTAVKAALSEIRQTHKIAMRQNLVEFIHRFDWMLLAICAYSSQFRNFMLDHTVKAAFRDEFDNILSDNIASLKLFACSRDLNWKVLLSDHDEMFATLETLLGASNTSMAIFRSAEMLECINRENDRRTKPEETISIPAEYFSRDLRHPHELAFSEGFISEPMLHPQEQSTTVLLPLVKRNIETSVVLPNERYEEQRQSEWPIPDPRWRSSKEDQCRVCNNRPWSDNLTDWQSSICNCTIESLANHLAAQNPPQYAGALIELVNSTPFAIGVRALQSFSPGALLAEVVGEIYPPEDSTEYEAYIDADRYVTSQTSTAKWRMYRLKNGRGLRHTDTNAVCQIDSAVRGNWTRYLNHSCSANTRLQQYSVGDKVLMCVRVEDGKSIAFGECLTMDYGRQYFIGKKIPCRCGEDCCTLWNEKRIGNNRKTLGERRMDGTAPAWALD